MKKIGLFDSGAGGYFIFSALKKKFPKTEFIYFADTKHFPYAEKSVSTLRQIIKKNLDYLFQQGSEVAICACNTAESALEALSTYPLPVKGVIEASLKQASQNSLNQKVGLLATKATVKSNIFLKKAKYINKNLNIYQQACPRLAPFVQRYLVLSPNKKQNVLGTTFEKQRDKLLSFYLKPLIKKGVDTCIMGCTHYLYLQKAIEQHLGPNKKTAGPVDFLIQTLKKEYRL